MNPRRNHHVDRFAGRQSRRGVSLIELAIAISTLAALMSFGTVLLGLLFRADHVGQEALAEQMSIARLSRQFRADVHTALTVIAADDNPGALELTLDDGRRVTWSAEESGVSRIVLRDDAEVARETYSLPEGATTFVHSGESGVVTLRHRRGRPVVVEHAAVGAPSAQDVLKIEAAVGIEVSGPAQTQEPMSSRADVERQASFAAFSPRWSFDGDTASPRGEGGRRPDEGRKVNLFLHPSPRPSPPNDTPVEFIASRGGEGE